MHIKEITNDEFETFTLNYNKNSIYQTCEYAEVMNNQKFTSLFLGLVNQNEEILAATLVLVEKKYGFRYGYAPHGFLIDYNDEHLLEVFTKEIKKFLGKKEIIGIKLNPKIVKEVYDSRYNLSEFNDYYKLNFKNLKNLGYYHLGYNNNFEALKPRFEAIIEMNKPYYLLFKDIKKSVRTKIRSAEHRGIKIYKGDENDLHLLYEHTQNKYPRDLKYFKEAYDNFFKKNKIDFYYAKLDTEKYLKIVQEDYNKYEAETNYINNLVMEKPFNNNKLITQKIQKDNDFSRIKQELISSTKMLKDNPEGIVMASLLVIKHCKTVTIFMDGFNPKYKRFNAKHLLIWKLIEKYSKMGYEKFSLGGIANPLDQKNKFKTITEFKLNFGAKSYEYIGDLEIITNKTLYSIYQNIAPIRRILKK